MWLFYIIFCDRNPPYPALDSNIPSARRPGQRFHFLQCRGSLPSLRFVNRHGGTYPKEGRVVCLHQNIFTRKVTHLPPTFAIIIYILRPLCPCIWSPRVPVPNVSASRTWCPQVPRLTSPSPKSPHTHPDVPVPLLYTAPVVYKTKNYVTDKQRKWFHKMLKAIQERNVIC